MYCKTTARMVKLLILKLIFFACRLRICLLEVNNVGVEILIFA